jgi:hypothetical protein
MQTTPSQAAPAQSNYPHIAVAVNREGSHVGLLYRLNSAEPKLLHLGWHHELYEDDTIRRGYAWTACVGFAGSEGRDLASWLQKVYRANVGRIPYGINYWPGACFDEDGVFTPSHDGLGLTCATFVMALFEAKSYPIINIGSWKSRADDEEWFNNVVDDLKNRSSASQEHIDAQIAAIGNAVRFRPLEVAAAAAIYDEDPIAFEQAVPISEQFKSDLEGHTAAADAPPLQLTVPTPTDEEDEEGEEGESSPSSASGD